MYNLIYNTEMVGCGQHQVGLYIYKKNQHLLSTTVIIIDK